MFFQKAKRIKELESQVSSMQSLMTPEMNDILALQNKIKELIAESENIQKNYENNRTAYQNELNSLQQQKNELNYQINSLKQEIIECNDEILYQECGLYEPKFIFQTAEEYKNQLVSIRNAQKEMIKNGTAVSGSMQWTVDKSLAKGKKMVKDTQKLLLRAFNDECDTLVDKVKVSNYDSYVKRMNKACETISKLGSMMSIAITSQYHSLKLSELALALDYQKKKEQEKEDQREARQRLREEAALRKEIEEARKKIIKEQTHYEQALNKIIKQLETATPEQQTELVLKQHEIEEQLKSISKSMQDIDYREANQRAGYVYIISNIGAFGNDVYKIGMTRRLEPMDRIYELGDASVPFKFDVHALIFSDDAPSLENALHKAFEDRKVNMVNTRREFFRVTLDEIKAVVKSNFDKTVEFIDFPEAEEFRLSQKMCK